jgi:hypothetical protein
MVCLAAETDQPVELRMADIVLLPGECARPRRVKGGRIRAELVDGRGGSDRFSFVVGRGRRATIEVAADGEIDRVHRETCDSRPPARPETVE